MKKTYSLRVEPNQGGVRLDTLLVSKLENTSRSQIKKWIEGGHVLLEGSVPKASHALKGGELIEIQVPEPKTISTVPQDIPLDIIYEDNDLLVLNKAADLVVHPGAGNDAGTLVNAILHHCQDLSGIGGALRPGIVHRLDKGTSGLLVVAKNDLSHQSLSKQFKAREVSKVYLAIVWGTPPRQKGVIHAFLGRHPKNRKKMAVLKEGGREAITEYEVLKSWGEISYLRVLPKTGRTHQIRVHLSHLGYPLLGDQVYGRGVRKNPKKPKGICMMISELPYHLLHAHQLSFVHPKTGEKMSFETPERDEMIQLRKKLDLWKASQKS